MSALLRDAALAVVLGLAGAALLIAWASEDRPLPECATPAPATEIHHQEMRT